MCAKIYGRTFVCVCMWATMLKVCFPIKDGHTPRPFAYSCESVCVGVSLGKVFGYFYFSLLFNLCLRCCCLVFDF